MNNSRSSSIGKPFGRNMFVTRYYRLTQYNAPVLAKMLKMDARELRELAKDAYIHKYPVKVQITEEL